MGWIAGAVGHPGPGRPLFQNQTGHMFESQEVPMPTYEGRFSDYRKSKAIWFWEVK